mgnify:CR=1 FL=1
MARDGPVEALEPRELATLAAGADAGERDAHGRTAVMLAASEKHAHLVETLCAYSMPFPEDAAHAAIPPTAMVG